jgi:hypothetical protein
MWRRGLFFTICCLLLAVGAHGVTRKIPASGGATSPLVLDEIEATLDLTIEGELNLGTVATFTGADTTPDVAGSSYWKTGGGITITDFDGSAYTAGQIFVLEILHNTRIDCDAGNLWCGDTTGAWFLDYTNGDILTWIYRSTGQWALLSEALRGEERTDSIVFIGATINEANDIGVIRMPTSSRFPTMTRFSCVASGATVADLDVFVEDCDFLLTTCGAVGATAALSANDTLYEDTTFDDPVNATGRWWKFNFGTVTLAPEILQCEISYVTG